MPTVPRLDTRRVGPNVVRQPQQTAAADPFAGVAAGLGAAAEMVQREVETARQRGNEIRLNSAEVKVRELRNRILNDRDKGVLNQRGENSFKAPEEAEREWTRGLSAIGAELTDPDVQEAFRARADQLGVELRDVVNRHVTTEMDRVDEMTTKNILQDTQNLVIANAADSARVGVEMVRAEETLRRRLTRQGIPEDVREAQVAEARSNLRLAQVEALATRDPEMASKMLTDHLTEITPSQREKARDFVDAANMAVRSQRAADDLYDAFKGSEADAIREAERMFKGDERDQVVRRLEVAFARERRLEQEEIKSYTDAAMNDAYAGRAVARETQAWLASNGQSEVLRAAERVQVSVARGVPVETNVATYAEVSELLLPENRAKFLETNLLAYADRLSDTDLKGFINAQTALRGGTRTASQGVRTASVLSEMFTQAQGSGFFRPNVKKMGDVELYPEDKEIFNVLRGLVETNLAAAQSAQKGELSGAQVRQIIRQTLDAQQIETVDPGIFSFEKRVVTPRANPALMTTPLSPAAVTRANELKAQGRTREEALEILQREGLLTPTP